MSVIRPFRIPDDLDIMLRLIEGGFQYPENPSWSIQDDEKEGMLDSIKTIRRIWPLARILKIFAPFLQDIMHGFIYEEDDKPVGLINFGRQRNTPEWYIGNVTVLPDYRRRGIAKKLIEASLAELRAQKAQLVWLEVIADNVPAYHLYETMGFEAYSSSSDYDIQPNSSSPPPPLNNDLSLRYLRHNQWEERMEFTKRITPEKIQHYEPIKKEHFRTPVVIHLLIPLIQALSGAKTEQCAIYKDDTIVAIGRYSYRTKAGGVNNANLQIDPAHSEVASAMLSHIISMVHSKSPDRRLELRLKNWQSSSLQAAEDSGCTKRFTFHKMAVRFE